MKEYHDVSYEDMLLTAAINAIELEKMVRVRMIGEPYDMVALSDTMIDRLIINGAPPEDFDSNLVIERGDGHTVKFFRVKKNSW